MGHARLSRNLPNNPKAYTYIYFIIKKTLHIVLQEKEKKMTVHSGLNFYALGVGSYQKTNRNPLKEDFQCVPLKVSKSQK